MNQQEILDKTMQMAYAQGRKSIMHCGNENSERCLLRSETGAKCFIGMHIDDADYVEGMEDMEMQNIMSGLPKTFSIKGFNKRKTNNFWYKLLAIHDHMAVEDWPRGFKEFARWRSLSINVMEPIKWIK